MPKTADDAHLSRRRFLAAGAKSLAGAMVSAPLLSLAGVAGTPLVADASGKRPLQTLKLQLDWVKDVEMAGVWYAMTQGFYRDEGIELAVSPGGPNIDPVTLVASGSADVGVVGNSASIVQARSKGIPVRAIGAQFQQLLGCYFALKSSGIKSPKDFRGKRLGTQIPYLYDTLYLLQWAKIPQSDVKIVPIPSNDVTPLLDHKVDAMTGWVTEQVQEVKNLGHEVNVMMFSEYGFDFYANALLVNDHALHTKKALFARFLRATRKGWLYARTHPKQVTELTVRKYGTGLEFKQQYQEMVDQDPYMISEATRAHGLFWMTPYIWERGQHILKQFHQISRTVPVQDLFTDEVLVQSLKA